MKIENLDLKIAGVLLIIGLMCAVVDYNSGMEDLEKLRKERELSNGIRILVISSLPSQTED